ncbi:MAG TPA: ABC transporter permease [Longimicrobiales bacterium]
METLLQDVRFAFRTLVKSPGFAAAAVLTLALGTGANTAIFSFVDTMLLRPLPFEEPDRLVMVWQDERERGSIPKEWTSPPNFVDWRAQNATFDAMAAFTGAAFTLTGDEQAERISGAQVAAGFFDVLRVRPLLGRTFTAGDEAPGAPRVAVLSYGLWQRRFDGDPGVVGNTVRLGGEPYTVIGVLPSGFEFPYLTQAELWAPLQDIENLCGRRCIFLRVVGRLADGVTPERAQADLNTVMARLAEAYPQANRGIRVALTTLHEEVAGPVRPALLALLGAVGFLLLIGCANVANLLLARAARRETEIAVRGALGAGKGRLARQLLTESLLLAAFGGIAGVLLGTWGIDGLVALVPPGTPRVDEVGLDVRVLGFAALVSLATGAIFGLAPVLHVMRGSTVGALRDGRRGAAGGSRRQRRVRDVLAVGELALSLVMLVGAGLMLRSFVEMRRVDPGFRTDHVLTARLSVPGARYAAAADVTGFYDRLLGRLAAAPGVRSAAANSTLPLTGSLNDTGFLLEGQPEPPPGESRPVALIQAVTPDYFDALGIPLRRGRTFDATDRRDAPPVVIVDETLAGRYFPDENPIGRRIDVNGEVREIVGVVGAVLHTGIRGEVRPTIYAPHTQFTTRAMSIVLHTATDPLQLAGVLRAELRALDPTLATSEVTTMARLAAESVADARMYAILFAVFAAVALLLAAIGVYGVIAYSVAQRTAELGLRMALGADRATLLGMVVGHGLTIAALGAGIGLAGAFGLTRLIAGLLFGVRPTDPATFVGVTAVLGGVAMIASYLPARRATEVDPMVALRTE